MGYSPRLANGMRTTQINHMFKTRPKRDSREYFRRVQPAAPKFRDSQSINDFPVCTAIINICAQALFSVALGARRISE